MFWLCIPHNRSPQKLQSHNKSRLKAMEFCLIRNAACTVVPFEMHLIANRKEERGAQQCEGLRHFSHLLCEREYSNLSRQTMKERNHALNSLSLPPSLSSFIPRPILFLLLTGGLSPHDSYFFFAPVEQHIHLIARRRRRPSRRHRGRSAWASAGVDFRQSS